VLSQEVAALAGGVPEIDGNRDERGTRDAARRRPATGRARAPEQIWVLLCGLQGRVPAAPFARRRLVAIVGDHPTSPGTPARASRELVATASAVAALADRSRVGVRVVDMCLDDDVPGAPEGMSRLRVTARRRRDRQRAGDDAARVPARVRRGVATADARDRRRRRPVVADLARPGARGRATALVCAMTDRAGRGRRRAGVDDATWMRRVVVVRDALRRRPAVAARPDGAADRAGRPRRRGE
jgi:hypothetical protein